LQKKVLRLNKIGIIFSLVWLAGLGSLAAFILGIKARRIIKESNGELSGIGGTWWCLIVGFIGMMFWFPLIMIGIMGRIG
jgi:hypothetical protein